MGDTKHSLQFSMTPDFRISQRLGFTSGAIGKGSIRDSLVKFDALANAGRIVAVPGTEASKDDLASMVALKPGESAPADGFGYTYLPCYVRVVTDTGGAKRAGAEELELPEGISDAGLGADLIS